MRERAPLNLLDLVVTVIVIVIVVVVVFAVELESRLVVHDVCVWWVGRNESSAFSSLEGSTKHAPRSTSHPTSSEYSASAARLSAGISGGRRGAWERSETGDSNGISLSSS